MSQIIKDILSELDDKNEKNIQVKWFIKYLPYLLSFAFFVGTIVVTATIKFQNYENLLNSTTESIGKLKEEINNRFNLVNDKLDKTNNRIDHLYDKK